MIDLGRWASEKYGIPGEKVEPSADVNENKDDNDDSESSPGKR